MTLKGLLAGGVAVSALFGAVGCGDQQGNAAATNLSQPLPPPPVGSGGGGKAGKAGASQQGDGQKAPTPTTTAD
jgi:hypothetical protein